MKITSPLTKTVGANTYAYTYDPNRPHAVKTISYTGTSPLDMGPRAITYNAEQMPIRIEQAKAGNTTIVDYLYDGTSTRIKKSVQGGAITYYLGEHCEVINGVLTNYIFAGNLRVAKVSQQGRYYFHKDHLGSSTAMTDATGAKVETTEYVPYGEMREHTGAEVTNYKFTDQELDPETGLYNYGARLYDPVIARFISADPYVSPKLVVNLASLPRVTDADFLFADPQRLNRYSYCLNNPLKYIDPNGLSSDWVHGKYKGVDYDISTTSFNPFTGFIHFMPKEFGILAVNISTALFGHTTLASRFAEMGMHVIGEHASFAHRLGPVLGVVVHDMLSIVSKVTNVFADLGLIPDSLRVNDPDEPSDSKALAEAMAAVAKAEQGWRSQGDARNNNHCDPYGTESIGYGDGGSSNSSPEGMSNSGSGDGDDGRVGDPWGGSEDSGYNSGDDNGFDGL